MKPKIRSAGFAHFFQQDLEHLLDQRQLLYKLANQLPWEELEKNFESYYSEVGHPEAGKRSAIIYMLVQNCIKHEIDPQEYLIDVL